VENEANFARLENEIMTRYSVLGAGNSEAPMVILHGGARGADQLADRFARAHELTVQVIRPDYQHYPEKLAPLMRNTELVALADAVMAFYGPRGQTGGTYDTVKKALARNLPVTELFPDGTVRHTPAQLKLFL
jgi:hypothetical protein